MNKKHGFTLSELLMSIAIIAVVSAMGITIAKRNTDDAYKTYFAVGTMNLNNALAQIESGNVNVRPNAAGTALEPRMFDTDGDGVDDFIPGNPDNDMRMFDPSNNLRCFNNQEGSVNANDCRGIVWVTNNLKYLFGDPTPFLINNANAQPVINASNGITYQIIRFQPRDIFTNGINTEDIFGDLSILMEVPAPRKRNNNNIVDRERTIFRYIRHVTRQFEVDPQQPGTIDFAGLGNQHLLIPTTINMGGMLSILQNRHDLLTAYIDDGTVGRHVPVRDAQGNIIRIDFMPIQYGTYLDALCTVLGNNNVQFYNSNIVVCQNVPYTNLAFDNNNNNNNNNEDFRLVNCSQCNVNGVQRAGVCQRQQCTGNVLGTAPSAGVIKFASPRKLK